MAPRLNEFDIMFAGLNDGVHDFQFHVDEHYFELHAPLETNGCSIKVDLQLTKSPSMLVLEFKLNGEVVLPCDRCLDDVSIPVKGEHKMYVKFGGQDGNVSEDVIVVSENTYKINVSQYIYEFIALSIPSKVVHAEGVCNNEVINKLNQLSVADKKDDSHWEILKELNI